MDKSRQLSLLNGQSPMYQLPHAFRFLSLAFELSSYSSLEIAVLQSDCLVMAVFDQLISCVFATVALTGIFLKKSGLVLRKSATAINRNSSPNKTTFVALSLAFMLISLAELAVISGTKILSWAVREILQIICRWWSGFAPGAVFLQVPQFALECNISQAVAVHWLFVVANCSQFGKLESISSGAYDFSWLKHTPNLVTLHCTHLKQASASLDGFACPLG